MQKLRIVLIVVALVCFGVALSYPIRYRVAQESNNSSMEQLSALREKAKAAQGTAARSGQGIAASTDDPAMPTPDPGTTAVLDAKTLAPEKGDRTAEDAAEATVAKDEEAKPAEATVAKDEEAKPSEAEDEYGNFTAAPAGTERERAPVSRSAEVGSQPSGVTNTPEQAEVPLVSKASEQSDAGQPEDALTEYEVTGDGPEAKPGGEPAQPIPPDKTPQKAVVAEETPEAASSGTAISAAETKPGTTEAMEAYDVQARTEGTEEGGQELEADVDEAEPAAMTAESTPTPVPTPTPTPDVMDLIIGFPDTPEPTLSPLARKALKAAQAITPEPSPTPDRRIRTGAQPYDMLEKVELDPEAILPELKEIYDLNHDLVGWITIPDTLIDYPVVQREDGDYYLSHDFYGEENINGQIILDPLCDPYTPSYNLVISGHHMKNGSMFGRLPDYVSKSYWERHKFLEFDTLMARKQYVIFAAFYSADYDEDEAGFRYNVNVEYKIDADHWLAEIRENQLYDTGIDVAFGDEFITLTTCNRARHKNGRFVVVCRKIREGEVFE